MSIFEQLPPTTPVLVGAGSVTRRDGSLELAPEPVALMAQALRLAGDDAGVPGLLTEANSIRVPRGFWSYRDPGRLLATAIRAPQARSVLAEVGILQQSLISAACADIAAGQEEVTLVVGGEARHRAAQARRAGVEVTESEQEDDAEPNQTLRPSGEFGSSWEGERGLMLPVACYAVLENALAARLGLSPAQQRRELDTLGAALSAVAAANPEAWSRTALDATALHPSKDNPYLAHPYTRLDASQWNVDQAAGLLLCSAAAARRHGVAEERWLFPLAAAENNHMSALSSRGELHRCHGMRLAIERTLDGGDATLAEVDLLDLYSCFPSALRLQLEELGLERSAEPPPTITGGMRFAGGPLNNYVLQATARMAMRLRDGNGRYGLISCVSGILHKQAAALWGTKAPTSAFCAEDISAAVAELEPPRALRPDYCGAATVCGHTVNFNRDGTAQQAAAICEGANGERTVACSDDSSLMAAMMAENYCGRSVMIPTAGQLELPSSIH